MTTANTWFNNGYLATTCTATNDTPSCGAMYARPQDKKNDYGVEVDGRLVIPHFCNGRNKLFFLYSWEQFRWSPPAIR